MRDFPPTRETGLRRLEEFLPLAGGDYTERRNHVPGTVSALSPYVRHRLLTEDEIAGAVLKRHSFETAEKFLQEVCWRTYWKGWLEMRPDVWTNYLGDLKIVGKEWEEKSFCRNQLQAAEQGVTGLACMDAWIRELKETGYLHNHVRMWFASIWIHTLRLPWQLGADFFLRHLLDGDPASNTLSWRWVCGLQTPGKVYLASAENIERFTEGRHAPYGLLAKEPPPIPADHPIPKPRPLSPTETHRPGDKTYLFVTEEDLLPEDWDIPMTDVEGVILLDSSRSGTDRTKPTSDLVKSFRSQALESTRQRLEALGYPSVMLLHGTWEESKMRLKELLAPQHEGQATVTMMRQPVGVTRSLSDPIVTWMKEEGISVRSLRRGWDEALWPHATHGFFRFKEQIPSVLSNLG
jgi:deoxyribodipyrimidine photo-lyase